MLIFSSWFNLDFFSSLSSQVPKDSVVEGEAQRYFEHAVILKNTITFLRYEKKNKCTVICPQTSPPPPKKTNKQSKTKQKTNKQPKKQVMFMEPLILLVCV